MNKRLQNRLISSIRQVVGAQERRTETDQELLQRFLGQRDKAAFAAVVRRHGPMVLRVAFRTLQNEHDAEDVFQATFLVLSQKAHTLRRQESLGSWLYGIAYRLALKTKSMAVKRRNREQRVAGKPVASPLAQITVQEAQTILDEELTRLPKRFREPVVLCCLEGFTRDEAAQQIGCPASILKSRLEQARERLGQRLIARGLTLPCGLGAFLLLEGAARATVSPALIGSTSTAAIAVAAGQAASTVVTAKVAALTEGVLKAMLLTKIRIAGVALAVATMGLGGGMLTYRTLASEKPVDSIVEVHQESKASSVPAARQIDAIALPAGALVRLGTLRFNHGDGLNALFFLPDGKTILSEGGGTISSWDAETGKELDRSVTAKPDFDDQTFLAVDGKTLTSLNQGWDDTIRVWDVGQRKEIRTVTVPLRRGLSSVYLRNAISPDGKLCALNMEKEIRVLDLESGRELRQQPLERNDEGRPLTFAGPDLLVTADKKKQTICVWQARNGALVREFKHGAPIQVLTASPDGKLLATLEHHNHAVDKLLDKDVIHIWDPATGTEKHQLAMRPKRWTMNLRFSPDGKQLLSSSTGSGDKGIAYELTVWDVETGQRLREMPGLVGQVMVVSPDGKRLACGLAYGKFELFDLTNGKPLSSKDGRDLLTQSVVLSSDGKRATTVGSASVATWDAATGRRVRSFELPTYGYSGPYLSPDGRYIATNKVNEFEVDEIKVWDVAAGKPLNVVWHPEKKTYHYTCAFDTRSTLVACVFAGEVHLVDLRTDKEIRSFAETKAGWPWQPFFTPDGKTLLVAGLSKVAGYDVASGKELFTWQMQPLPDNSGAGKVAAGGAPVEQPPVVWRKFVVSPTGTVAAGFFSGGFSRDPLPDRLFLCDARTGKLIRRWSDSGKPTNGYEELAFSADGRLLASSDFGHVIHVWEVATGKELYTFNGHRGEIRSLAFSGDGQRLASASTDSTVLVWSVVPSVLSENIDEQKLNSLWMDLIHDDPKRAYAAVWQLARAPDAAVDYLRRQIHPIPEPDKEQLRRLVQDLDSDTFAVREKAQRELERLGAVAVPALRGALGKEPSAELRRRAEKLLELSSELLISPDLLRQMRALHALEQIGSPESQEFLKNLAKGAAEARLTREAKATLERLHRQRAEK